MKHKKNIIVILVLFVCAIHSCGCAIQNMDIHFDIRMFSDISECKNIELKLTEDASVSYYNSPEKDPIFYNFDYNKFVGYKYISKQLEFKLFAYEFVDSATAKKYFEKGTGRKSEKDSNFFGTGGLTSYQQVVIENHKAYVFYTSSANLEKVQIILQEIFPTKLTISN